MMSDRDTIAAMALQGLLASGAHFTFIAEGADLAYAYADCMIARATADQESEPPK